MINAYISFSVASIPLNVLYLETVIFGGEVKLWLNSKQSNTDDSWPVLDFVCNIHTLFGQNNDVTREKKFNGKTILMRENFLNLFF